MNRVIKASTLLLLLMVGSCEKDITIDLPLGKEQIVVEGVIEVGIPPYIILTKSQPFFGPTGLQAYENSFVHDATVTIQEGSNNGELEEFCSGSVPDVILEIVAEFVGISTEILQSVNFCVYSTLNPTLWGIEGKSYNLTIKSNGETLTASTSIPEIIKLDTVFFKVEQGQDSLGFAWAHLTDPDTLGNHYRWFARRINTGDYFQAPIGSAFEDKFINGKSFDFAYDRPVSRDPAIRQEEYDNGTAHFYSLGDSIVIKFCTIDKEVYDFVRTFETSYLSSDNPFAAPSNVLSNINGGLGIFAGYGVAYDTLVAVE